MFHLEPRLQPEVQGPEVQPRLPVLQLTEERCAGLEATTSLGEVDERPRVHHPARRQRRWNVRVVQQKSEFSIRYNLTGANPAKLLRVKIKSEFYKFSKNVS